MVHQCKTKKEFLSNLDQVETDAWMERIASYGWEEDKKDTLRLVPKMETLINNGMNYDQIQLLRWERARRSV